MNCILIVIINLLLPAYNHSGSLSESRITQKMTDIASHLGDATSVKIPSISVIRDSDDYQLSTITRQLNFVSCPIIRDSKTLPCWLAKYDGELYYLGQQGRTNSAFYPPQLNHQVLVEGTISNEPRICGGIPLKPVRISVMQEIDRNCNTLLPPEDGLEPPNAIPPASREPLPDSQREFIIPFNFDSDYLTLHTTLIVSEAVRIAKLIKATKIEVYGYRATTLLSNGNKMVEKSNMAEVRAKKIGGILTQLGLLSNTIHVQFKNTSEPCDGINDANNRRVTIQIK